MRPLVDPTEDEFESFPPVVKRKYFSTHERLRLAHAHVATPTSTGSSSRSSSPKKIRKRPSGPGSSNLRGSASRRHPKKARSIEVSNTDAQWFLQLPDKLQRKQFTIEEQVLFSGRRESVILDASDEALLKVRLSGSGGRTSPPSLYSIASSMHTIEAEEPADSAADINESIEESFRWLDENDRLDLTLDDYHIHMVESTVPAAKRASMRPTFRRSVSMSSMALSRDSLSMINIPHPAQPIFPGSSLPLNPLQPRRRSMSTTTPPRPFTRAPTVTVDPSAKHYQDPEARLKLRVYLASPQKFDEALEFGFPSMDSQSTSSARRPSTSKTLAATSTTRTTRTFFNDDDTSLSERVDEDEASLPDAESPRTPSDATFRTIHSLPSYKPNPPDWKEVLSKPFTRRFGSDSYAHAEAGNREMTLRMTLTRPDLRADESLLYPQEEDPLALEHLPPAKNARYLWDDRSNDGGMVKKLWRRVSRR